MMGPALTTHDALPRLLAIKIIGALALLAACADQPTSPSINPDAAQNADDLLVVDCLLPGQIRRLGSQVTYVTRRRAVKTSAVDCEIRGGEYTAYDRANYKTALKIWLPQAKEGSAEAQSYVGEIYEKGMGVAPDYKLAAHWYEQAAEQGDARAQVNLGYLYETGRGVPQDLVTAMNWYRRASGLTDDDLTFASSVAVKEKQIEALRLQVEAANQQTVALEQQLRSQEKKLTERRNEYDAARREVEQLKSELNNTRKQNSGSSAPSTKELQLRRDLEAMEQQSSAQKESLDRALVEVEASRRELAVLSETITAAEPPTIEIVYPTLSITRGAPAARLRSDVQSLEVTGRVNAPGGLRNLYLNDQPLTTDSAGFFTSDLDVPRAGMNVAIIAIDKNGQRTNLEFQVIPGKKPDLGGAAATPIDGRLTPEAVQGISFGDYHALVIGNNSYDHFQELTSARRDAESVALLLRSRYGFNVSLLLDGTRSDMLKAINGIQKELGKDSNLLIYYAGHGELAANQTRGHWLPVDAQPDQPSTWISNAQITDILETMKARHIMVVADSCYSGTLTPTSIVRTEASMRKEWMQSLVKLKARMVLSSGGLEPVLDTGGGEHSVFAEAFIETLRGNQWLLAGYELWRDVHQRVRRSPEAAALKQNPQYSPIKNSGHQTGDFFFVPII